MAGSETQPNTVDFSAPRPGESLTKPHLRFLGEGLFGVGVHPLGSGPV